MKNSMPKQNHDLSPRKFDFHIQGKPRYSGSNYFFKVKRNTRTKC